VNNKSNNNVEQVSACYEVNRNSVTRETKNTGNCGKSSTSNDAEKIDAVVIATRSAAAETENRDTRRKRRRCKSVIRPALCKSWMNTEISDEEVLTQRRSTCDLDDVGRHVQSMDKEHHCQVAITSPAGSDILAIIDSTSTKHPDNGSTAELLSEVNGPHVVKLTAAESPSCNELEDTARQCPVVDVTSPVSCQRLQKACNEAAKNHSMWQKSRKTRLAVPGRASNLRRATQGHAGNLRRTFLGRAGNLGMTSPRHAGNRRQTTPGHTGNLAATTPRRFGNQTMASPGHAGNQRRTTSGRAGNLVATTPRCSGNLGMANNASNLGHNTPAHAGNLEQTTPRCSGDMTLATGGHASNLRQTTPGRADNPRMTIRTGGLITPAHAANLRQTTPGRSGKKRRSCPEDRGTLAAVHDTTVSVASPAVTRLPSSSPAVKRNAKGETALHRAAIKVSYQ